MTEQTLKLPGQSKELKAYSKPELIEYGRVEEITKATGGSVTEYPVGMPK